MTRNPVLTIDYIEIPEYIIRRACGRCIVDASGSYNVGFKNKMTFENDKNNCYIEFSTEEKKWNTMMFLISNMLNNKQSENDIITADEHAMNRERRYAKGGHDLIVLPIKGTLFDKGLCALDFFVWFRFMC